MKSDFDLNSEFGKDSPKVWRKCKWDGKTNPWESGNFRENGEYGKNSPEGSKKANDMAKGPHESCNIDKNNKCHPIWENRA